MADAAGAVLLADTLVSAGGWGLGGGGAKNA
jgi:hypothetical protein